MPPKPNPFIAARRGRPEFAGQVLAEVEIRNGEASQIDGGIWGTVIELGGIVRLSKALQSFMTEATPAAHPVCPISAFTLPKSMGGNSDLREMAFCRAPNSTASPTGVAVACASTYWMEFTSMCEA